MMIRKSISVCLSFAMLLVAIFAVQVQPATAKTFSDIEDHWARSDIEFLADKGIVSGNYVPFRPDEKITRGEAVVMLKRVSHNTYGVMASPDPGAMVDQRYSLANELKEAIQAVDTAVYANVKAKIDFKPGTNMLYLLQRGALKQPLLFETFIPSNFWLSSQHLSESLTREEASMLLFHFIMPDIIDKKNTEVTNVASMMKSYYAGKPINEYKDTRSLYATGIKGYHLLETNGDKFNPNETMTRAEFAVSVKSLYDHNEKQKEAQFNGNNNQKSRVTNMLLTVASHAYQTNNQEAIQAYFSKDAIATLDDLRPLPLHNYVGKYQITDSTSKEIRAKGIYNSPLTGDYEIEYLITKTDQKTNPYGWQVTKINFTQK
ncbi:S-layer homology domain-containing protein [Brevibacillus daliensis]|uniref:S-layer homology domain-containing protein n=1 Tax=Brevibacillus daliensis TaxID=2892995 RepID=UPI001E3CDAFF|nr:S-layer homology domain-containing protein [Brevibacillus daliensis]